MKKRRSLSRSLVLFVFAVLMAAMILAGFLVMVLHLLGIIPFDKIEPPEEFHVFMPLRFLFSMMMFSIFLGTAIAAFFSKKALKPIRKLGEATQKVAKGQFDVKVDENISIKELSELAHSFNKMTHELSGVETLRSDFINNFSHEFKTPIVSIQGFAELLIDGGLSEEEKLDYLKIIRAESQRLAELSTNVLNLSKYEATEIITEKAPFSLDEQIRRAVVLIEPKWSEKGIEVDLEMEEIIFNGNEDLTQQIWLNLLDNAVKFSETGGTISMRLRKWNNSVRFTIQDNGAGFDETVGAKIFEKFYQADSSRGEAGNGLGLSIVKRITELYGGKVEAKSEKGKGSRFTVFLPN